MAAVVSPMTVVGVCVGDTLLKGCLLRVGRVVRIQCSLW